MDKKKIETEKKIVTKPKKKKPFVLIFLIIILLIVGAGVYFHIQQTKERERQLALEEERRLEEAERERERRFLEEKKNEFENLIQEMRRYFNLGNFKKVRELAEQALLLAKEYNFPTDEIKQMLHRIDVNSYRTRLKKLQAQSEDMYLYPHIRAETLKIPNLPELRNLRTSIINKTYENEYKVTLAIAHQQAKDISKGTLPKYSYLSSKTFLEKGISVRKKYNLKKSEEESVIMDLHNKLFFTSKELPKETVPTSLYR